MRRSRAQMAGGPESRLALHRDRQTHAERPGESFNGRMREERLSERLFPSLRHGATTTARRPPTGAALREHS